MLKSLDDFLTNEYGFKKIINLNMDMDDMNNKKQLKLEYRSTNLLLFIEKDLSDFEAFSLDGRDVDIYESKQRLTNLLGKGTGVLKAFLQEYYFDFDVVDDNDDNDDGDDGDDNDVKNDNDLVADGFENDSIDVLKHVRKLPKCDCVTPDRDLVVYVWGRKKRKHLPRKVDHNFNAAKLYGKKSGTDWTKDGRTEAIREAVMKCPIFNDFLTTMIETIESKNASSIGINCRAGRHRSVTCAIILKQYYYPKAQLHFLEIR